MLLGEWRTRPGLWQSRALCMGMCDRLHDGVKDPWSEKDKRQRGHLSKLISTSTQGAIDMAHQQLGLKVRYIRPRSEMFDKGTSSLRAQSCRLRESAKLQQPPEI